MSASADGPKDATPVPQAQNRAALPRAACPGQVTDRIYQIRGFDISNMTIIEVDRGVIVIDPLISTEVARGPRSVPPAWGHARTEARGVSGWRR